MSKRVFVVDDERTIADTLAQILKGCGYQATAMYDGESALANCAVAPPDLIISDVIMPGISGIELAIEVRRLYPGCKLLLFSGMAATNDLLEAARLQGHEFEVLAKPIHPADLLEKIAV